MNDIKESEKAPVLLGELLRLVGDVAEECNQKRIYNRVLALVMAELFAFGRHTITQLLLTLGLTDEEHCSWYRLFSKQRFPIEGACESLVREVLRQVPESEPLMTGGDGFPVARSSLKMPGTSWLRGLRTAKFRPGIQRVQRFFEGSWLTPLENGYSYAIPLRCLAAFTEKAVAGAESPCTEVGAGLKFLHWLRGEMDKAGRQTQMLVTLNDGAYDTLQFWSELPKRTVGIVRTARNRALHELPAADAHGNTQYGPKAKAPSAWLQQRKGFKTQEVLVRSRLRRMRFRVEGPYLRKGLPGIPFFLLVIGGGKRPEGSRRKRYEPCFYLISAVQVNGHWTLPLPITEILAWVWQRWELEVCHRQMKSGLGLGEKQCWNGCATVLTVQWSVWVYALLMLSGYLVWGTQNDIIPPGRWRKRPGRWSFNTLLREFRCELWHDAQFRATWSWSRDNWAESESRWDSLFNSILASTRI